MSLKITNVTIEDSGRKINNNVLDILKNMAHDKVNYLTAVSNEDIDYANAIADNYNIAVDVLKDTATAVPCFVFTIPSKLAKI